VRPRPVRNNGVKQVLAKGERLSQISLDTSHASIDVSMKRDPKHSNGKKEATEETWSFKVDKVLEPSCSQEDVYKATMEEMLQTVMNGYNGTVMAYGQTGAGKTHTMIGKQTSVTDKGLAARTISNLFKLIAETESTSTYTVRMSYLEIYKERLYDLLDNTGTEGRKNAIQGSMQIFNDKNGNTFLKGLSRRVVANVEEAIGCLFEGETNRVIASHELNYSSTRSHCILTFHVEGRHMTLDESVGAMVESNTVSKLNLVDLAGSERTFKTNSSGLILQEAKSINKSLSFLEQVVVALSEKKRDHIPYRQSHLTHYLKDSLGGNCKSILIACIWPEQTHSEQTLATLKFATRMMRVKNTPVRNNQSTADSAVLVDYKNEIQQLRAELALRDQIFKVLTDSELPEYTDVHQPFSQNHLDAIEKEVELFIRTGDFRHVKIQSVRHANAMFTAFRKLAKDKNLVTKTVSSPRRPTMAKRHLSTPEVDDVEDYVDDKTIQSNSVQPTDSPKKNLLQPASVERPVQERPVQEEPTQDPPAKTNAADLEKMFERFKTQIPEGMELFCSLNEAKKTLMTMKQTSKQTRTNANKRKQQIDTLLAELQEYGDAKPPPPEMIQSIKAEKKAYKKEIDKLKEQKAESAYTSQVMKACREKLAEEFEKWAAGQISCP